MTLEQALILTSLVAVAFAIPVTIDLLERWDDYKWNKAEERRIKLKEAEQLIKHVKSMTAPKPQSLEPVAAPQAKRRGRPSKTVAV